MKNTTTYKRGDKVTYQVTLAFGKGTETRTGKIVAIRNRTALLDTGDSIFIF